MSRVAKKSDEKSRPARNKNSPGSPLNPWSIKVVALPLTIALGIIISMCLPISVPVEISAEVNRATLTAANSENNPLLPHTAVCSIDLGGFTEVQIPSASVWIGNLARVDPKTGAIPENEWRLWRTNASLVLRPSEPRFDAKVTVKPLTKCGDGLSIDGFHTGFGEVVIASPEKDYLSIDLKGEQHGSVVVPGEFALDAEYCNDTSAPFPISVPEVRLRIRVAEGGGRLLTFLSARSGMFAQLEFARGQMQTAVISNFPVQSVGFTNQGPLERPESTLTGPGMISYYGKNIGLAAGQVLTVEGIRQFKVLELSEAPSEQSLNIHMKGFAKILRSGTAMDTKDRRPTLFDALSGDPRVEAIAKSVKIARDFFK